MLEDYVYVVGVVTIDVKKDGKFPENYTYVFTSYIKWLEENNVRWIQISIHDSPIALYKKLQLVDGIFLTGGSQDLEDAYGFPTFYKNTLVTIFEYAKNMNDRNIRFPIVATCLGFESMISILTNEELKLQHAPNQNESQNIYLLPDSTQSFLTQIFTNQDLNEFSKNYVFYFSHHEGFLMKDVEQSKIFQENISALGFYLTNTHERALGIIQHKYYPFVAWQFHPEKVQFEHNDRYDINKSKDSRNINSQFGKVFNLFLQGQQAKNISNQQVLDIRSKIQLIENYNHNDEAYIFPPDEF